MRKIVHESVTYFREDSDPVEDMGIGFIPPEVIREKISKYLTQKYIEAIEVYIDNFGVDIDELNTLNHDIKEIDNGGIYWPEDLNFLGIKEDDIDIEKMIEDAKLWKYKYLLFDEEIETTVNNNEFSKFYRQDILLDIFDEDEDIFDEDDEIYNAIMSNNKVVKNKELLKSLMHNWYEINDSLYWTTENLSSHILNMSWFDFETNIRSELIELLWTIRYNEKDMNIQNKQTRKEYMERVENALKIMEKW